MKNRSSFEEKSGALTAILFGGITVFAGGGVLFGFFNPGYHILQPLLIFNFIMGFIYVGTGLLIWKKHSKAIYMTLFVLIFNLLILFTVGTFYLTGGNAAIQSVIAMAIRAAIWLLIYLGIRPQFRKLTELNL
ncbi:MAG: hypothetical protein HUJ22_00645 [Gracilimonas sp.]|uniref:hypothetical protein n=1 Tax=Gracilimonas sp. TaxID=1974203 RepID=UPI0019C850C3|nr:hypothetical protein [Gracilimonas sp.]MBD3615048.1 hypothetical protein [Gracilimonas sp.]